MVWTNNRNHKKKDIIVFKNKTLRFWIFPFGPLHETMKIKVV
jgi:hypothetical protein